MIRILSWFIIGFSLSLCIKQIQQLPEKARIIAPELEVFVKAFEEEYKVAVTFPILLEKLSDYAGVCEVWATGHRRIQIDTDFFEHADYFSREATVFHELGHCVFDLEHDNERITVPNKRGTFPKSLMDEFVYDKAELEHYKENRTYYIEELRSKRRE